VAVAAQTQTLLPARLPAALVEAEITAVIQLVRLQLKATLAEQLDLALPEVMASTVALTQIGTLPVAVAGRAQLVQLARLMEPAV